MADKQKPITDANRRISRRDRQQTSSPAPPAGNDVEEANDRISREPARERDEPLRREQALKRPPD